jgi:hypothetical protein
MIFALLHNFISLVLDELVTVGIAADEKDEVFQPYMLPNSESQLY